MKTQISHLINGDHRKDKDIIGTDHNDRRDISKKVISENPEFLTIQIKSYVLKLTAQWSVSRKSCSYFGSIPVELYKDYFGDFGIPKEEAKAYIHIQQDMSIEFSTNSKKNIWQMLPNKEVTILG
jgi:hypothetical protein